MREQHALLVGAVALDLGRDRPVAELEHGRDPTVQVGGRRVVAIMQPVVRIARSLARPTGQGAVVQRQDVVAAGFDPPAVDHPLEVLRFAVGQVVGLGEVLGEIEQLPLILVVGRAAKVSGDRLPAVHPDGTVAPHFEVLHALVRGGVGIFEGVGHALAVDRHLGDSLVGLRSRLIEHVQDRGHDVGDVVELVANLTLRHPLGPTHDQGNAHSPAVGVALVPAQRRVGDLGPTPGDVGPAARPADVVESRLPGLQSLRFLGRRRLARSTLEQLSLVGRDAVAAGDDAEHAHRAAHPRCAVVRCQDHDGVVELARIL